MRREFRDENGDMVVRDSGGSAKVFLVGLALGAAVALLFAPQSGAQTRREIRRGAERARKRAARLAEDIADTVSERFDDAKHYVEEGIASARHGLEEKKRQVATAVDAGRRAARQTRQNLEHRMDETRAAFEAGADVARSARRGAKADEEIPADR